MERIFSIPFFAQLLSEKFSSPMDTLLNSPPGQSLTPEGWSNALALYDGREDYVVTEVEHYKERSFKDVHHEFLWIRVRHREQPTNDPYPLIRVERTIRNNTVMSRLGLWGPASDSLTILARNTPPPSNTVRLRGITWQLDQAPSLRHISTLILDINRSMPDYHLLKASCYTFSRGITEAIDRYTNGVVSQQQTPFLFRKSRFLGCVPTPTSRAHDVAQRAVQRLTDHLEGLLPRLVSHLSSANHYDSPPQL